MLATIHSFKKGILRQKPVTPPDPRKYNTVPHRPLLAEASILLDQDPRPKDFESLSQTQIF